TAARPHPSQFFRPAPHAAIAQRERLRAALEDLMRIDAGQRRRRWRIAVEWMCLTRRKAVPAANDAYVPALGVVGPPGDEDKLAPSVRTRAGPELLAFALRIPALPEGGKVRGRPRHEVMDPQPVRHRGGAVQGRVEVFARRIDEHTVEAF